MNCGDTDCSATAKKRGFCETHYRRFMKHGNADVSRKAANGAGYVQGGYLGHQINGVRKFDHVRIAEAALGKLLPPGAIVHHADECKTNNEPTNLVICPSRAYHNLIHARLDALKACGNPEWRKCRSCLIYDDLNNLTTRGTNHYHRACETSAARKMRASK